MPGYLLAHAAGRELRFEGRSGRGGPRDHDDAAGLAVEAVHELRLEGAEPGAHDVDHGVSDERAVGVHRQQRRLVDDQHRCVAVQHGQHQRHVRFVVDLAVDELRALAQAQVGARDRAIHQDAAGGECPEPGGAVVVAKAGGQVVDQCGAVAIARDARGEFEQRACGGIGSATGCDHGSRRIARTWWPASGRQGSALRRIGLRLLALAAAQRHAGEASEAGADQQQRAGLGNRRGASPPPEPPPPGLPLPLPGLPLLPLPGSPLEPLPPPFCELPVPFGLLPPPAVPLPEVPLPAVPEPGSLMP